MWPILDYWDSFFEGGGERGRRKGSKDFLFFSCDEIEGINWEK